MCWITLSPTKGKHHHGHHSHSEDGSSAEELVRVTRVGDRQRYSRVTIKAPTGLVPEHHHHDHHGHLHPHLHHKHHHHIHPLHLHPMHGNHHHHFGLHHHHHSPKLHGHGRKISFIPPVPPPTRSPSHCRSTPRSRSHSRSKSPCAPPSKEPMYRTQIVEPAEVRETTRIALREIRPDRPKGKLRRVAGYEVLGREVPWAWDCVSSVADSGTTVRGRRKGGSLKYPPFGTLDRWM